jgi:hypothetical protein
MNFVTPNPELDCYLYPCPRCGASYIPEGKRPAILMFTIEHYQVVCLRCNHRSPKSKDTKGAMHAWNELSQPIPIPAITLTIGGTL